MSALALAALLVPVGGVGVLAGFSSLATLLAFSVVNATLIVLRRKQPDLPRPFRVPGAIGGWPLARRSSPSC